MVGVVFRPGGARLLLAPPAEAFFNRAVSLDAVWGSRTSELVERLCEAPGAAAKLSVMEEHLRVRVASRLTLHDAVRHGLMAIDSVPHVGRVVEVAKDAGLSRRRFAELFRAQVGTTPKLYCRLRRFQAVVRQGAAGAPVDWARVAAAGGYSDQSHLSREFREFSGLSPRAWVAAARPSLNHVVEP
jgi:AraC-like DNA-binding protein